MKEKDKIAKEVVLEESEIVKNLDSEDEYAEIPKEEVVKEEFRRDSGRRNRRGEEFDPEAWGPITKLGMDVKTKKITKLDEILNKKRTILEPGIVDYLIPVKSDLISIGQSKGKFGGGKRRAWKQTQRKTKEGNVPTFAAMAVIGDEKGHVGIGLGRAKETLPARAKAVRKAKLNVIKVTRGCGSFDCADKEEHSIPFKVEGKSGSVRVTLLPAPQGTGLVIGDQGKKILKMAGIKDVYSRTAGKTRTTGNFAKAIIDALKKTNKELKK